MLKRLLSLLICVAVLPVASYAAETEENTAFNERIEKLAYLGVTFDEGTVHSEAVTRAKYVRTLLDFVNVESHSADCGFFDVDADYPYSDEINTGASRGFMIGYPDGNFYPEKVIAVDEAVKAIVNALGYEVLAKQSGGYPLGYIQTADSIGLLEGIKTGSESLTYDVYSKLLENALECSVYEMNFENGNPSYGENEDVDALWKFHRIIKVKSAVVTANSVTGMVDEADKTSDKKYAELNGETVLVGDSEIADYLGYTVEAYVYYDEDEDYGEVKYIELSDKNITVTVKPENILDDTNQFSAYNFVYETDKGKIKNVKITEDTYIIYNGIAKADYKEEELVPEIGNVTLIDNNSDNDIDCIKVFKAEKNIVVDYVSSDEDGMTVVDKRDSNNTYFYDEEYENYEIYVDGIKNIQSSILKDMVLLIGTNGKHSITYAYSNVVEGKIDSVGKADNGVKDIIKVGDTEYYLAPGMDIGDFKLGLSGKFLIDDDRNVYYFEREQTNKKEYGYFVRGYFSEDEEYSGIKVLTKENKLEQIEFEPYVKYNGSRKEVKNMINFLRVGMYDDADWKPQLIMYELSENGKVSAINTVEDDEDAELTHDGTFYHCPKASLPDKYLATVNESGITGGNMWLDKENNVYWGSTHAYAYYYNTWNNIWYNDTDTVWFVANESEPEKSYVMTPWEVPTISYDYTHELYNEREETSTIGAVVWRKEGGQATLPQITKNNRAAIVKTVTDGLNADNEPVKTLECIQAGKTVTVMWNDDADQQVKDVFSSLKAGDIIYYTLDAFGEVDNMYRSFNINRVGEYGEMAAESKEVHDGANSAVHIEKRCTYVKIKRKLQNNFYEYIGNDGDNLGRLQKMFGNGGVYRMTVRNNKVTVETISYDDVMAGDDIFCHIAGRSIPDMIVIDVK